jgi:hypothetical protein
MRSAFFLHLLLVPSGSETRVRSTGTSQSRRAVCFTSWVSAAQHRVPASHRRTKIWHRLDTTVKLQATWSICLKFRASHKADVAWAPQLPFPDESESGHRTCRCTLNSPELELAPARRLFVHLGLSFLSSGVVAFRAVDLDRWIRWAMSNFRALLALRFKHIV